MTLLRRSLFWKVYLTLLTSLAVVALAMGAIWWLLGESPQERWDAFRTHLNTELIPSSDVPTSGVQQSARRLGDEIGADVSIYGADGHLIAAQGRTVFLRGNEGQKDYWHVMRIDMPGGRVVMARLHPPVRSPGLQILIAMLVVAGAVGLAAFPVTARLTRRLENLRSSMALWGSGESGARADERGSDEVALVARTFNIAAERLDLLLASQRAMLANASHELRSPLARLRLAIELWSREQVSNSQAEIVRNLAEIDALVEEILLSSRLAHPSSFVGRTETVDLLGLAAEEAARVGANVEGAPVEINGNSTLLRRLLRNLLENAVRHGRAPIDVLVSEGEGDACLLVSDCGPGIAPAERERVFEPFYRPQGRSEDGGGWGLGLALVRQIAERHGGVVTCGASEAGGSRFEVRLPEGSVGWKD